MLKAIALTSPWQVSTKLFTINSSPFILSCWIQHWELKVPPPLFPSMTSSTNLNRDGETQSGHFEPLKLHDPWHDWADKRLADQAPSYDPTSTSTGTSQSIDEELINYAHSCAFQLFFSSDRECRRERVEESRKRGIINQLEVYTNDFLSTESCLMND